MRKKERKIIESKASIEFLEKYIQFDDAIKRNGCMTRFSNRPNLCIELMEKRGYWYKRLYMLKYWDDSVFNYLFQKTP